MKKIILIFLILSLLLSGCTLFGMPRNPIWDYDFSQMNLIQLEEPQEGQTIITVYTTLGVFSAMLFPEHAPKTVANFIERVEEGFYENRAVLAVREERYFLTGAFDSDGRQGVTSDGKLIPNEYSADLWPFKGAMLSYSGREGFGDSRFLVVGSVPFTEEMESSMRSAKKSDGSQLLPDELIKAFAENDSIAEFSARYTIFGQVIDGFDVLDKLLTIPTGDNTRPLEEHFIEKIEISQWKG